MFLGEGKQAQDHQSRQDKSGYEVLHHGYHSTGLAVTNYSRGDIHLHRISFAFAVVRIFASSLEQFAVPSSER
jgi:hypothetical protein